ncbi:hypothetical protein SteCoe_2762 [Stentor coeruleus]|uniref:Uncharacterized protein n=1 Tax=Stentor coeruleus TaxID=5963 RepID=A0A1R2CYP5_9CILI|nr:hypothetical protein SteCoe_2762 [Stentor coeruleus]
MKKRTLNSNSDPKFVPEKKFRILSAKPNSLVLPHLRENNQALTTRRLILPPEEPKNIAIRHKNSKSDSFFSPSPRGHNPPIKTSYGHEWSAALMGEKIILKPDPKTQAAEELYQRLLKTFNELDSLELNDTEKQRVKKSTTFANVEERIMEISREAINAQSRENTENSFIQKNRSPIMLSFDTTSEDVSKYTQIIDELKKKITRHEEVYAIDIGILKKKVEKRRKDFKKLECEYENLLAKHDKALFKYESLVKSAKDSEKMLKSEIEELKQKLKDMNEMIHNKNYELVQATGYMQRNKIDRREKEEIIKELQDKMYHLADINTKYISEATSLKSQLKSLQSEIEIEKKSASLLPSALSDIKSLQLLNSDLEERLRISEISIENLQGKLGKANEELSSCREKAEENDSILRSTIEKLMSATMATPSNSHVPQDHPKIRRHSDHTQKSLDNISSDMNIKLLNKLQTMKDNMIGSQQDIEKYKKDIEYYKKSLEERDEFIKQVESKLISEMEEEKLYARKEVIRDIFRFIKQYEKSKGKFYDLYSCERCKDNIIRQIFWPCESDVCKRIADIEEVCENCRIPGKTVKVRMLKELIKEFKDKFMGEEGEEEKDISVKNVKDGFIVNN